MTDRYIVSWAVHYDTPEHPGMYEARMFHNNIPQDTVCINHTLEHIRQAIESDRFIKMLPFDGDPPTLVEVWI